MQKSVYVAVSLLMLSTTGPSGRQCNDPRLSCALKDAAACGNDANCMPIDGQAWNDELSCASDAIEAVGCMDRGGSCPASIRYVVNDKGAKYQVTSGCLPTGFTDFTPTNPGGRQCE